MIVAVSFDRLPAILLMGIKPWMVPIVGPIYFLAYLGAFYGLIKIFNQKTPDREEEEVAPEVLAPTVLANKEQVFARQRVLAFDRSYLRKN